MTEGSNRQLLRLSALLQLQQRLRHAATPEELGFIAVNESRTVLPFQQAALWIEADGRPPTVHAVSGVATPDPNSAYLQWLGDVARVLSAQETPERARDVTAADVPGDVADAWADMCAVHLAWMPLVWDDGIVRGALLLGRSDPWAPQDLVVLQQIADALLHAWTRLEGTRGRRSAPARRKKLLLAGALLVLLVVLFIPVRQSSLAPAEVVPKDPLVVRAPLEGVVDTIHVAPSQTVDEGELLLSLDPSYLRNRLDVALRERDIADAEYRQAAQQSVFDQDARASLAVLQGRLDQAVEEVTYLEELLGRIDVRAEQAGIAIIDDPVEWIGRPVVLGERIMTIAESRADRARDFASRERCDPPGRGRRDPPVSQRFAVTSDPGRAGAHRLSSDRDGRADCRLSTDCAFRRTCL